MADPASKAECLQWKEYAATRIARCGCERDVACVLRELDAFLASRVHMAGGAPSPADQDVYQQLHPVYQQLGWGDKQRYQHVSRWMDHAQRTLAAGLPHITFLRTPVYSGTEH